MQTAPSIPHWFQAGTNLGERSQKSPVQHKCMQPSGMKITLSSKKGTSAQKNPLERAWKQKNSIFMVPFFFFFFPPKELDFFSELLGCASFFLLNFRKWKTWVSSYSFSVRHSWRSWKNRIFSPVQLWVFYSLVGRIRTPRGLVRFFPPTPTSLSPFRGCRGSTGSCDTPLETHPETARGFPSIKHPRQAENYSHFFPFQLSLLLLCPQGPPSVAQHWGLGTLSSCADAFWSFKVTAPKYWNINMKTHPHSYFC